MVSREKPQCSSCKFYDLSDAKQITSSTTTRSYTKAEEEGGVCQRASTPFRQPRTNVCACYEGPAISRMTPWWSNSRTRARLEQESLDTLAQARDDAAVLRCALSGAWRRANEARARSHELWAFLLPVIEGGSLPDAPVWRDRFTNVTVAISRLLSGLGDMAVFAAVKEIGIKDLGIGMPERDTGRCCSRCYEPMNSREFHDATNDSLVCRDCARAIGLLSEEKSA